MAKINILPAKVYNRIAAGEVVNSPYSVVKELVENAIDAGSTEIEISIEQGGKQLIRVTDNGCGIARDDLHSAFLPHATSKIAQAEDLENIVTLGFRGEAVASIAAVSKMTITSKTIEGKCYSLTSDCGELGQITESAGNNGTDVCVEMLFYNTPVRLNFLKSDKAEETDITNFISRFVLSRPDIAFTYYANGKQVLQSFGGSSEEALVSVYGASILNNCYKIDASKHGIHIYGYIGNQNFSKPNKSYQSIFLNGRYIVNSTISAAISNAYASYLMKRQYPFYVLHIDMPTEIVDVNVHPNKTDVRFADNQIVYGCIYTVIAAVLDGQAKALEYVVQDNVKEDVAPTSTPDSASEDKQSISERILQATASNTEKEQAIDTTSQQKVFGFTAMSYEEAQKEIEEGSSAFLKRKRGETPVNDTKDGYLEGFTPIEEIPDYVPKSERNAKKEKQKETEWIGKEALRDIYPDLFYEPNVMELGEAKIKKDNFAENKKYLASLEAKNKQNRIDVSSCTYTGKLFNTYILYECADEVYIIDQHAAHERLLFDRFKSEMEARNIALQPMFFPFQFSVNETEKDFICQHIKEIEGMGFLLKEGLRINTFDVMTIPSDLPNIDLKKFFDEILANVEDYRSIKLTDILKDKLASAACKAAVKGGMDLTKEEIDGLFKLMDGDMGLKCPHGRPVVVKMTKTELEKMFKRIV